MNFLDGAAMRAARTALDGLSRRSDAISANIANIDTAGYQRKSVDFEQSLATELGRVDGGHLQLARTDPRHLGAGAVGGGVPGGGASRDAVSERNDSNSVSIDEEMTALAETQIRYQALTQTIGQRLSTLRTVIRG